MSSVTSMIGLLVLLLVHVLVVKGHGRLLEPPSRASMWRVGYNTPRNYNDNQMFCGGFQHQWEKNMGRCGVCGDPWDGRREHEAGGKYARGIIVRNYTQGSSISINIDITANHKGYFEFRLCAHNNPSTRVSQQCLDQHVLSQTDGSTRFRVTTSRQGMYNLKVRLPAEVTCTQCLLQWKYNAGNSWGCEANGKCCIGCGHQEQFYGCADVAILPVRGTGSGSGKPDPMKPSKWSSTECRAVGLWAGNARIVTWCRRNCAQGNCPLKFCSRGCLQSRGKK